MASTREPSLEELRQESERNREALASTVGELRDRVGDTATELKTMVSPAHIKQEINGYTTIDYTEPFGDETPKEGIIALQLHTGPKMKVEFKDIEIKELPDTK